MSSLSLKLMNKERLYWFLQLVGWGGFAFVIIFLGIAIEWRFSCASLGVYCLGDI